MKLVEIVRFELAYQLRRKSTWFFVGVLLIPLIGATTEQFLDPNREILFNSPLFLAEAFILKGLGALVILAAIVGDSATRDVTTRMEPLMHAAPVRRLTYLGGRFLGAFTLGALLLTAVPVVHIMIPLVNGGLETNLVAPIQLAAYLQAYVLLMLPNAFVAAALMFALASLMRHTLGSYITALLIFVGAQLNYGLVAEILGRWDIARILDPIGLIALAEMSQTWSPMELNERLIGANSALVLNRLIWLAIAAAALVYTTRRFKFRGNAGALRWWQRGPLRPALPYRANAADTGMNISETPAATTKALATPNATRDFAVVGRIRQTLATTRDSLREVMPRWSWALVVPFVFIKIVTNLEALASRGGGTQILPTTSRILEPFGDMAPPIVLAIILFPVLLAGELVWRERDANIAGLSDAAPVTDGVRFFGKLLGLFLVIAALYGASLFADVLTQVHLGWYDFEPALYAKILGLQLTNALLFASFAFSLHVIVNQKHVGHVLVMVLFISSRILAEGLQIEHPLFVMGYEPGWRYSPISGFEPFLSSVLWFDLYWVAWAVLLALVARLFWVRGDDEGMEDRFRIARRRFTGRTSTAIAAALGVVFMVGGFIFYNTNVLNEYLTRDQRVERQAEYERRYGQFREAAQPRMTASELTVEIYPDRREADVRGVHHLINLTTQPIDTIHVSVSPEVTTDDIELGRPARIVVRDDAVGHRIYVLEQPLQPGDSLSMQWRVHYHPRGFPAGEISTSVVQNGTFIRMPFWTPLIGYQPYRELAAPGMRRAQSLPVRQPFPPPDDIRARFDVTGREAIDLDITVGTASDQVAVAPGELIETWSDEGRSYFRYVTNAPIGNEYAIFSARYAVRQARWRDVTLEVVHHPAHDLNVGRMMSGMEASLEQFTARFGPYPYKVLRMVEYSAAGGSLHAAPGAIWYQELFSLFDPENEARRIDMPFAVTGHEVAHQFQPRPARAEGAALLSESFAWYAALGVIEETYGVDHLRRFLDFMRRSYQTPRSRADVPLLRATDSFLAYRKGPFAMYALREYVGQEQVDAAWRTLRASSSSPDGPFATSLDLYRELQQVTPDSLQNLLHDLFEANTFWELEAGSVHAVRTDADSWHITLNVNAKKVVVDTAGVETDVPMDDWVEIGIFAAAEGGERLGAPLYRRMHRIRSGPQTITVSVNGEPAQAGIDPYHLLIDWATHDNVSTVEIRMENE